MQCTFWSKVKNKVIMTECVYAKIATKGMFKGLFVCTIPQSSRFVCAGKLNDEIEEALEEL